MEIYNKRLQISSADVAACDDLQVLRQWQEGVEEDIAVISNQMDAAIAKARATGEYADPRWFASLRSAKRFQDLLRQKIGRRIREVSGPYPTRDDDTTN